MESFASKLQQFAQLLEPIETEVTSAKQEVADLELRLGVAVTRLNEAQRKQSDILGQVSALARADDGNISNLPQVDAPIDIQQRLSTPLHSLSLPTRVVNSLEAERIYFLGDLVQHGMPSLSKMPGIGKLARSQIIEVIESNALSLNMDTDDLWQRPTGHLPKK